MLIPHENEKDLIDIPDNIKGRLEIRPVKWIDEVLDLALEHSPIALPTDPVDDVTIPAVKNNDGKSSRVKH